MPKSRSTRKSKPSRNPRVPSVHGTFKEMYMSNMNGNVNKGSVDAEITEDHIDYIATTNGKTEKGRIELYPNQYGFHGTPTNTYVHSPTKGYHRRKNHRKTRRR
jgi:hypothetical protein